MEIIIELLITLDLVTAMYCVALGVVGKQLTWFIPAVLLVFCAVKLAKTTMK